MQNLNGRPKEFYQSLPKVELHRHLEGSLRLSTILEVAHAYKLNLPLSNPPQLRSLVQVQQGEPKTSANFLKKFETLRLLFRSPEIIRRVTREAIADAAADNVRYLELRFTPFALSKSRQYPLSEVMDWVTTSAREAAEQFGVTARLIASVNRNESIEIAEEVAWLAVDRARDGIVGLDLAGDEANHAAKPFSGIFKEARQSGLRITIHAGEWGNANNIIEAIESLDAERIGHGVRVFENLDALTIARERGIVFEVCPTSNYQSGVIPTLEQHPLPRMLDVGLNVTINTDDPGISNIDLSDECHLACESLSISLAALCEAILNAAHASFLPESECQALADSLEKELLSR